MRVLGAALVAALMTTGCSGDGPTGPSPGPTVTVQLAWPMGGIDGLDWVINNYVDLDPGAGLRDYRGGSKVYDDHQGVDIDVPNFRWMDDDFPIVAAAAGTVTGLTDRYFDRNVSCAGTWNHVTVTHDDGSRAIYGHLKENSVVVSMSETVRAGQVLAVVGSSGCSTQPHLHFELRDADNVVVDPFWEDLWVDAPRYDPPLTLMDINVQAGPIASVSVLKDPPPNIGAVANSSVVGVGLSMAGGGPGDGPRVRLTDPAGATIHERGVTFNRAYRHTYWYWNLLVDGPAGTWTLTFVVNGTPVRTHDLDVS